MEVTALTVEPEGWVLVEGDGAEFRVLFQDGDHGRVEPIGVKLEGVVLTNRALSEIPFGRIELLANAPDVASAIRASLKAQTLSGVRVAKAPTFFPGNVSLSGQGNVASSGRGDVTVNPATIAITATVNPSEVEVVASTIAQRPTRYDDGFYAALAVLYKREQASGRPGAVLAEVFGVPVSTVWRWIRVARDKGYLPPALAGKAG